ncbi:MAG: ATP-binding protein [Pirellulales bacterium]
MKPAELNEFPAALARRFAARRREAEALRDVESSKQLHTLWRQSFIAAGIGWSSWSLKKEGLEYSINVAPLHGLSVNEEDVADLKELSDRYRDSLSLEVRDQITKLIFEYAGKHHVFSTEFPIIQPDGGERWVAMHSKVEVDDVGQPARVLSVLQDIDARKRVELALQDSERRFRDFMDKSPIVAFIKHRDGRYVYANKLFREVLIGPHAVETMTPEDRVVGRYDYEIYPEPISKHLRTHDLALWNSEQIWYGIEEVPLANGELRSWWVVKFLFANHTGERFLGGMALDMSDRLLAEERARELLDELAHVNRLGTMGKLTSELAHELNQPLYATANYAEACLNLLDTTPDDRATQVEWLTQILAQTRRMREIVRRVSGYSSRNASVPEESQINELIEECCELMAMRYRKEQLNIRLELDPALPEVVLQPLQFQQIVVNLITNAHEALRDVPAAERSIVIRTRREDARVVLEIADTGPGITPEIRAKLFEPFATTKPDGMGLGLSIIRSIVENHGGSMSVRDNVPRGAVFIVHLPLVPQGTHYAHL